MHRGEKRDGRHRGGTDLEYYLQGMHVSTGLIAVSRTISTQVRVVFVGFILQVLAGRDVYSVAEMGPFD